MNKPMPKGEKNRGNVYGRGCAVPVKIRGGGRGMAVLGLYGYTFPCKERTKDAKRGRNEEWKGGTFEPVLFEGELNGRLGNDR